VWTVESLEKQVVWLEDIVVEAGKTSRHEVAFERGTLLVTATNAGQERPPGTFEFRIYRSGDEQLEIVDEGVGGEPLGLRTGRYDVEISFAHSNDKPARWRRGIEIRANETRKEVVDFSSGQLLVHAQLPDGQRLESFRVYVYYYRAGDHREPLAYTPAGETAILESGVYDVRAQFFRSHDRPDKWLRDISIRPGETVQRTVTFSSGWLAVQVYDTEGNELIGDNTLVSVHAVGERTLPVAKANAGEQIVLTAGEYDVHVEDTRRPGSEVWGSRIAVAPGKLSESSVTMGE